ncbi:hypothetical protein HXX76_014715 [Chlamydomonas incerta]|uniref:Helicase C-terminal domain-containing protein n=1 Tax=Chlamydomonas incerta TaxID=51695 RepID=A0A835VPA5_CHLIN|nr:hypothetical protein HXX76_014715 [Chlamydomonas incerta]|eukprot:KAG2424182.1 hypothetical protein HXX76_014715 [Chlamydomonas incerta]
MDRTVVWPRASAAVRAGDSITTSSVAAWGLLPAGAALLPAGAAALPTGATLLPAGAALLPAGMTLLPAGATLLPAGATLLPAGATLLPAGAALLPAGAALRLGAVAPPASTTLPLAITWRCLGSRARSGSPASKRRGKRANPEELSEWLHTLHEASKRLVKEKGQPLFDLIVFDEAHHIGARTWQLILNTLGSVEWKDENGVKRTPFIVFCTGTPDRIRNLSDFPIDKKLTPFTLRDALKKQEDSGRSAGPFVKKIVMLDVAERDVASEKDADEEEQEQEDGKQAKRKNKQKARAVKPSAEEITLRRQLDVMRAVAHLLTAKRHGSDVPHRALVTVNRLQNVTNLVNAIEQAQLPMGGGRVMRAAGIHGEMTEPQRSQLLARFKTHNLDDAIDVLVNDRLLVEGYDEALVSVVVVLKTYGSPGGYAQFVGRGVRLNQAGHGLRITPKDNVCHIVTHRTLETVGIFHQFTRESERLEELQEDVDGLGKMVESEYGEEDEEEDAAAAKESDEDQEDSDSDSDDAQRRKPTKRRRDAPAASKKQPAQLAAPMGSSSPVRSVVSAPMVPAAENQLSMRRYLFPLPPDEAEALRALERSTYFQDRAAWVVEDIVGGGSQAQGQAGIDAVDGESLELELRRELAAAQAAAGAAQAAAQAAREQAAAAVAAEAAARRAAAVAEAAAAAEAAARAAEEAVRQATALLESGPTL